MDRGREAGERREGEGAGRGQLMPTATASRGFTFTS